MSLQRLHSGVAYKVAGDGPAVLLMHGFPDTLATWDRTAAVLLDAGLRPAALGMRGTPPSAVPADRDFSLTRLGRDALDVMDDLGARDAVLVGHDWGGSAAFAAAALAPERVRAVVSLAVPPLGLMPRSAAERLARPHRLILAHGAPSAWWLSRRGFGLVDRLYAKWSPHFSVPASHLATVKTALAAPGAARAVVDYYRARDEAFSLSAAPKVPVLVIHGNDEPAPRRAAFAAARETGARVIGLDRVGHWPHLEAPAAVHRHIFDFLASLAPPGAPAKEMAE